jgi:hypothetical protein
MMRKAVTYKLLTLSALLVCYGGVCWAISITATGSWPETIDASDLAAGSDLISIYESASNALVIDISETAGNWAVDVKKLDTTWHNNLHLYIKRTSDGSGPGTISGGATYQELTDTDLGFFSGSNDRSNINIQLKLTGVTITVPPNVYNTMVYYTVYDQ